MNETQLFWTFVVSAVGPLVAAAVLWWGTTARWYDAGRRLLALTLAVGVLLAAFIAFGDGTPLVVTTVFGKAQPLFYGMPFALDRFAAIFFAAIGSVGLTMLWNTERKTMAIGALCVVLSQLVVVSGSVMGFLFFWLPLAWVSVQLCGKEGRSTAHQTSLLLAGLMILAGWFLLTGGALFNDFQTIGYASAGVEKNVLRVAYVLLSLGFLWTGTAGAHPILLFRKAHQSMQGAARAVLSATLGGAALYGFLRMSLFVMPEAFKLTSAIFSVLVLLAALGAFVRAAKSTSLHDIYASVAAGQGALVFAGLTLAMIAVSKEAWSLMNLVLFSAVIGYLGSMLTLIGSARLVDWLKETFDRDSVNGFGGIAAKAPWVGLAVLAITLSVAVTPFSTAFIGTWMQSHGMIESIGAYGWAFGASMIAYLIIYLVTSAVATVAVVRAFARVFLGEGAEHVQAMAEPKSLATWQMFVAAFGLLALSIWTPGVLVSLGADPIISNPGTVFAGIDTMSGTYLPIMLALLLVAFTVGAHVVRGQLATKEHGAVRAEGETLAPSYVATYGGKAIRAIVQKIRPLIAKLPRV